MSERDIFNTRAYNFLQGDRQVEEAIRELAASEVLVARNRLPNVLATVAGIADLAATGWGERVKAPVVVPRNALACPDLDLDGEAVPAGELLPRLLAGAFHVGVLAAAGDGLDVRRRFPAQGRGEPLALDEQTLVLVYADAAGPAAPAPTPYMAVAPMLLKLAKDRGAPLVFVAPRGTILAEEARPYLGHAWTTAHFAGRNAFALPAVEEAVRELDPARVLVLAPDPVRAFYTAVGAVDYFLTEDARSRDPRSLQHEDLVAMGGRVVAAAHWDRPRPGAPAADAPVGVPPRATGTLRELAAEHLQHALGVVSTLPDPRFRAGPEPIALDILAA